MTALHLVRAPIETAALARWAAECERGWVRLGRREVFDEGRALHHLLDETLGGAGLLRPFRLLVPPRRNRGRIYAYSTQDAQALRAAADAYALPDHRKVLSPERMESKPMPENWRAGQRLGFDLRMRPVRRLSRSLESPLGEIGKGAEIDAFLLEALRRRPTEPDGIAKEKRTREAVYLDWLTEQLAPAASLDRRASRLARFRRVLAARAGRAAEGPDAVVHGALTVTDPDAFAALLARGVGRHRAYGYGMILLRPPNRPAPER